MHSCVRTMWCVALAALAGCGAPSGIGFDSLANLQPQVASVMPEDGATAAPETPIEVAFTRPVLAATVERTTLAIIPAPAEEEAEGIVEDVQDGDVPGMEGVYDILDQGRRVVFHPSGGLAPGASYAVIATTRILGEGMLPLNQRPGGPPTPFISVFSVSGSGVDAGGAAGGESAEITGDGGAGEPERVRPAYIMINELLYDAVGSDTDGDVFVELYGEAGGDITGFELVFVNGEDGVIKDTIELPDGSVVPEDGLFVIADAKTGAAGVSDVADANLVLNFDPQNGPDCLQLLNANGEFLDALGYGEPLMEMAENGLPCFEGAPAEDVASGESLARVAGDDSGDNAADFEVVSVPTPGTR